MAEQVDIPDEAYTKLYAGLKRWNVPEGAQDGALDAAAPHIARAAQVQILREWILDINLLRYETPEEIAKAMHVRMEWLKSLEAGGGRRRRSGAMEILTAMMLARAYSRGTAEPMNREAAARLVEEILKLRKERDQRAEVQGDDG